MNTNSISRRRMLRTSLLSGACLGIASTVSAKTKGEATPPQTAGPFYPIIEQADKDADLTKVGDSTTLALGEIVTVEGRIMDEDGNLIPNAVVDIWQANAVGRYAHETDPNPAPLDPNFQGWAIMTTDDKGRYRFKTVRPGAYPAEKGWDRPPHIHFKVSRRGYREITTQMYFEDEPLNDVDRLLKSLSETEQTQLIARRNANNGAFSFDVVLAAV